MLLAKLMNHGRIMYSTPKKIAVHARVMQIFVRDLRPRPTTHGFSWKPTERSASADFSLYSTCGRPALPILLGFFARHAAWRAFLPCSTRKPKRDDNNGGRDGKTLPLGKIRTRGAWKPRGPLPRGCSPTPWPTAAGVGGKTPGPAAAAFRERAPARSKPSCSGCRAAAAVGR